MLLAQFPCLFFVEFTDPLRVSDTYTRMCISWSWVLFFGVWQATEPMHTMIPQNSFSQDRELVFLLLSLLNGMQWKSPTYLACEYLVNTSLLRKAFLFSYTGATRAEITTPYTAAVRKRS